MDIFLQDPEETPLPPHDVRIRLLRAEPWPDGKRVRVYLEVDPFQKSPSAEIQVTRADGQVVARTNIVETISRNMEFNLHLQSAEQPGDYSLRAILFYIAALPEPEGSEARQIPLELPESLVVDQAEIAFTIPLSSE